MCFFGRATHRTPATAAPPHSTKDVELLMAFSGVTPAACTCFVNFCKFLADIV